MKTLFSALLFVFAATFAAAHEGAYMHHHLGEPNWLPLLVGLFVIAAAAVIGWAQK